MGLNRHLKEKLENIYSKEDLEILYNGFNTFKRKTSFRVNLIKSNSDEVEIKLLKNGFKFTKLDFIDNAYILENGIEKDLWNLDIYTEGKICIQSISSQIPVHFLDLRENDKILDITAAPGSKTSQIASVLGGKYDLYANDNSKIRLDKLNYLLDRQGISNVKISNYDARKILEKYQENSFDKILVDVPCSSEGRINLNIEKTYNFWTKDLNSKNSINQKIILENAFKLLKKGGTLVYSTCTISPEENEEVVDYISKKYDNCKIENIEINFPYARKGLKKYGKNIYKNDLEKTLRIIPNIETEGFYIAKIFKPE